MSSERMGVRTCRGRWACPCPIPQTPGEAAAPVAALGPIGLDLSPSQSDPLMFSGQGWLDKGVKTAKEAPEDFPASKCFLKNQVGDFPGGPVVRTRSFHCRGQGLHHWSGN